MQSKSEQYLSTAIELPPDFKEVFSHFYAARNGTDKIIQKTYFPSYQTIMVFNFGYLSFIPQAQKELVPVGKCMVLGPVRKAFDYRLGARSDIFVVNFKGDGFYRFFSKAMVADGAAIHPDNLHDGDHCFSQLWQQLKKLRSNEDRAEYILTFSRPYLDPPSETVEMIVGQSFDEAVDPIKKVADLIDQSKRNVQLKYKKHLGYSAKAYARYRRFIKTIAFLQEWLDEPETGAPVDWFEVIERNGYYDQSHLIRDFRYYLDLTPSQYLELHRDICIADPTGDL